MSKILVSLAMVLPKLIKKSPDGHTMGKDALTNGPNLKISIIVCYDAYIRDSKAQSLKPEKFNCLESAKLL